MTNALSEQIINKIIKLQCIVQNIIRVNQTYKTQGFLEANDLNSCIIYAEAIYVKLKNLLVTVKEGEALEDSIITTLQSIITEISTLISLYGCDSIDNLINVCIGHKFSIEEKYTGKYNLLNKYVKPIRYRTVDWNSKLDDTALSKTADHLECFDLTNEIFTVNFPYQVYGIKFVIHNMEKQQTLVVYGIVEDIMLDYLENTMINEKIAELATAEENKTEPYQRFIHSLTLKDFLLCSGDVLHERYLSYLETFNSIEKKPLSQNINDFIEKEIYEKREMLIVLLIHSAKNDGHYLAYLLYDLLSNDINGIVDTYEQTLIYDSLPYNIKKYFRDAMKQIVNYTNKLSNVNVSKISLEQRICLMKTSDTVKEKAMVKLKEVKMKAEDTGSKAMHYLDGLLKIPFEIYKEEPIIKIIPDNIRVFSEVIERLKARQSAVFDLGFPLKANYTNLEIQKYYPFLKNQHLPALQADVLKTLVLAGTKKKINTFYHEVKDIVDQAKLAWPVPGGGKSLTDLRVQIIALLSQLIQTGNYAVTQTIYNLLKDKPEIKNNVLTQVCNEFTQKINGIEQNVEKVNTYMKNVGNILDGAVYGHTQAKRQIERIIGQWLNGDSTGYCFGFEGPPGVGKTSLAKKGIAQCLVDEQGVSRPFAFIAMGGSTNSSTLDGHNYTYVGSTWGRIVDILMDTKIMNPIIFIDELDKVSKTENGKEIIGILTHLIDQTQNDAFQDKYFNGINLNLSKALFIFSYNDVELIDKILLDRIHRIKFETISVDDKLIIMRNFILPEIYKKMGVEGMIEVSDEVIEHIINTYTAEPGVRKLKELMFEIIGEINLDILKNTHGSNDIPILLTLENIQAKYLKDHTPVRPMKIHTKPLVGVINGMWANSVGKGGILPIEAAYFPSSTFLELKLTGMQGDVMKESMTVAKSLAWSLFSKDNTEASKPTSMQEGLHIHVPEGATPKDGPSAGTAITIVMYSLFSNRKIKNDVAITGEICLQGRVSEIGGLELKLLGGIRAGIKTFIYPQANVKDFEKFMEKYGGKAFLTGIQFIAVEMIEEVLPLVFI